MNNFKRMLNEGNTDWVVVLVNPKDKPGSRFFKGLYITDDEDLTTDVKKAAKYSTMNAAKADAKICNNQWELERGNGFIAMMASDVTADVIKGKVAL